MLLPLGEVKSHLWYNAGLLQPQGAEPCLLTLFHCRVICSPLSPEPPRAPLCTGRDGTALLHDTSLQWLLVQKLPQDHSPDPVPCRSALG